MNMDKQVNTISIILCTCQGRVSNRIDLQELATSLQKRKVQVIIADELCEDWTPLENLTKKSKPAGLIIGACSKEVFLSNLPEKLTQRGIDEFSTSTLDLLGQSSFDLSKDTNTRLAGSLLEGLLEKVKRYPGATPENLRPYWISRGEKISRRRLFSFPKVRYNLIPSVEKQRCLAWKGCYFCSAVCPVNALVKENDRIAIDKDLCSGCGACVAPCPVSCIVYPGFTLLELEAQLEALLSAVYNSMSTLSDKAMGRLSPLPECDRLIAFICPPAHEVFQEFLKKNSSLAPHIIPVYIPCLAVVSPYLIIKTLSLGAASVILLSCEAGCQKGMKPEKIESNIQIAQALVEALGIKEKIVHHFAYDNVNHLAGELEYIVKKPGVLKISLPGTLNHETGGKLGYMLAALGAGLGKQGKYELTGFKVPLGKVKIDPDKCTLCELCSSHCPTAALRLEESEGFTRIRFSYQDCVACNLCIKVCPERKKGAIKVERELDWDALNNHAQDVLVESKQIYCSSCGAAIGNSLMIDKIKKKLGPGVATAFDLCSHCRFKAALFRNSDSSSDVGKDSAQAGNPSP